MESRTYMKNIRVSPKKLRFLLPEVKRRAPQEALDYLMYSPRKSARIYYNALHSAINNAVNTLKVGADMLQFKLFTIEQGRVLKRFRAGGRGTARPIKKAYSHIKIVLVAKEIAKPVTATPVKKETKAETVEAVAEKPAKAAPKKATKKPVAKKKTVTNKEITK